LGGGWGRAPPRGHLGEDLGLRGGILERIWASEGAFGGGFGPPRGHLGEDLGLRGAILGRIWASEGLHEASAEGESTGIDGNRWPHGGFMSLRGAGGRQPAAAPRCNPPPKANLNSKLVSVLSCSPLSPSRSIPPQAIQDSRKPQWRQRRGGQWRPAGGRAAAAGRLGSNKKKVAPARLKQKKHTHMAPTRLAKKKQVHQK
jgi:hypothetical protein